MKTICKYCGMAIDAGSIYGHQAMCLECGGIFTININENENLYQQNGEGLRE